jgi:hypothetical protein
MSNKPKPIEIKPPNKSMAPRPIRNKIIKCKKPPPYTPKVLGHTHSGVHPPIKPKAGVYKRTIDHSAIVSIKKLGSEISTAIDSIPIPLQSILGPCKLLAVLPALAYQKYSKQRVWANDMRKWRNTTDNIAKVIQKEIDKNVLNAMKQSIDANEELFKDIDDIVKDNILTPQKILAAKHLLDKDGDLPRDNMDV